MLELGCGTGRLLEALAARGIEVVGIDSAPEMVALARRRLRPYSHAQIVLGDMSSFALESPIGSAFCAINTIAHLVGEANLERHLACVARHLRPGGRYLVQLELRDPGDPRARVRPSVWEAQRGDTIVRATWTVEEIDLPRGEERHRSRLEVIAGPRAGDVVEDVHVLAARTPEQWLTALARSPFRLAACYDGSEPRRPRRPPDAPGHLLWYELACRVQDSVE